MLASERAVLLFVRMKRVWAKVKAGAIWTFAVASGRGAGTTVFAKPVGVLQVGVDGVVVFVGYCADVGTGVGVAVLEAEAALQT